MNRREIRTTLLAKPGYRKYGYDKLSNLLNADKELIREVMFEVREETSAKLSKRQPSISAQRKTLDRMRQRQMNQYGELPKPFLKGNTSNVLIIGDTHAPFERPGYLQHCRTIQEKFNCGTVVHIGDEVDNSAISFHESDPDGMGANEEADRALEALKRWYRVFPEVHVCIGNHTALPFRKAFSGGLPQRFLRSYEEMWEAPEGWEWAPHWEFNGVLYTHGTGTSGEKAALNKALNMRQPVVQGHIHTVAGVSYNASPRDILWGMQVGCGIDDNAYSFAYARDNVRKSIISCGVVLNSGTLPIVIPMPL